jgi:hypothetical protein
LIANFYHVVSTTIVIVNTGSTSPSPAHPSTVWEISIGVPNRWCKRGCKPTSTGFCGTHGASAESQNDFVQFLLCNTAHCEHWVVMNLVNVCVTSYVMAIVAKKGD